MLSCLKLLPALGSCHLECLTLSHALYISSGVSISTDVEIPAPVVLSTFISNFLPLITDLGNQKKKRKRKKPVFRFVSKVKMSMLSKTLGNIFNGRVDICLVVQSFLYFYFLIIGCVLNNLGGNLWISEQPTYVEMTELK